MQAQMNEFMYKILREEGFDSKLDEAIGTEFVNLRRVEKLNTLYTTRFTDAT